MRKPHCPETDLSSQPVLHPVFVPHRPPEEQPLQPLRMNSGSAFPL